MRADWWRQASELGVTEAAVAAWTGHGRRVGRPDPTDPAVRRLFERLGGSEGLTARRSTFDRRGVVQAVADAFGPGADVGDIVRLAGAFVASDHVTALPVPAHSGDVLRRRDGSVVPLEHFEEVARAAVRLVFQTALENEVTEFFGRERYARGEREQEGSRNGYSPLTIKTPQGR